jgi:hypothetical protein
LPKKAGQSRWGKAAVRSGTFSESGGFLATSQLADDLAIDSDRERQIVPPTSVSAGGEITTIRRSLPLLVRRALVNGRSIVFAL